MATTVELAMAVAKPSAQIQAMADSIGAGKQDLEDVDGDEEEEEGMCGDRTMKTRIAQGVAGASIVVNIAAIALEQSVIMIVAGAIAVIIAPLVIMTQFKLEDTGGKFHFEELQGRL